jgi:hypothetical protein
VSIPKLTVIEELDTHVGYAFHVEGVEGLDPRDVCPGDLVRIGDSQYSVLATYGTRGEGQSFSLLAENRVID